MLRTLSLRLAAVAILVAARLLAPVGAPRAEGAGLLPRRHRRRRAATRSSRRSTPTRRASPTARTPATTGRRGRWIWRAADLSGYAVFVVPSLADGPDVQPYALLRNGTIAARIQAAFMGRVAVWSGTPDVGSTNRSAKDELIRNLAAWAKADAAGTHGPGVVALQDNSDDAGGAVRVAGRDLGAVGRRRTRRSTCTRTSRSLTSTGQTILTNGGLQIGYTNMASFGLVAGPGGRNDATGGRSSRVVLVTAAGEAGESTIATVSTDREDYSPGENGDRHRRRLGAGRNRDAAVPRGRGSAHPSRQDLDGCRRRERADSQPGIPDRRRGRRDPVHPDGDGAHARAGPHRRRSPTATSFSSTPRPSRWRSTSARRTSPCRCSRATTRTMAPRRRCP